MTYLVMQDDDSVYERIAELIGKADSTARIKRVSDLVGATIALSKPFDMVIFDLYLPLGNGQQSEMDSGSTLLRAFVESPNAATEAVLVTKARFSEVEAVEAFNLQDIQVLSYTEPESDWMSALSRKINRLNLTPRFDFAIFVALTKEAKAYYSTEAQMGEIHESRGVIYRDVTICGRHGALVEARRPGPVTMAVAATNALTLFRPRIAVIGGICAGFKDEVGLLDTVVADPCWDYQSGKFRDGKLLPEPYQIPIDLAVRETVELYLTRSSGLVPAALFSDLDLVDNLGPKIVLSAAVSGASVISDENYARYKRTTQESSRTRHGSRRVL